MTDFTIILRSLRVRMFSTVTTVLTVAVAVGLMLTLLSMRDSGRQAFERGSGNMHLLVSSDASPLASVLNSVFYANAPSRPITWARYESIAQDPRVEFAVPLQQGDSFEGYPVVATTPDFFAKFRPAEDRAWEFRQGRALQKNFEAVVGADCARGAGLRIGQRIALTHGTAGAREAHVHDEFQFEIVGVLAPTGSAHDRAVFTTLESSWMVHAHERHERENPSAHSHNHDDHTHDDHNHDHAHDDHDHDHHDHAHDEECAHDHPTVEVTDADRLVTGIYVRLVTRPGAATSAVLPQFASELRRDPSLTIASPTSEIDRLFAIVSNVDQVFLGIAAAVMLSSGIAIMLALYNSMNERRRQIAVLRVLGCSRGRVFGLVLTEAALVGIAGAAVGVGLALAGAAAVSAVLRERLGLVVRPVFTPDWVLVVCLATVLLGAAAGFIPAMMAYRTSVAKNLKPTA